MTIGPSGIPQSAYAAAKFAIRGFSESLLIDFRDNAPHVGVSVVMPGHIGSKIGHNTNQIVGGPEPDEKTTQMLDMFEKYGMPPAEAASIILDGVRNGKWRILVGEDAKVFDQEVRANPEKAYEAEWFMGVAKKAFEARQIKIE